MKKYLNGRLIVKTGDITKEKADAIVNAANSSLMGGGGVDGAIHRAGGAEILEECRRIRKDAYPAGLPTGKAVITGAGHLPSSYVIHTVGPVWSGGADNEDNLLFQAYTNSLKLASENNLHSIAFPAISTGIYGFPFERSVGIVSRAMKEWCAGHSLPETIILIFFSGRDYDDFIGFTSLT